MSSNESPTSVNGLSQHRILSTAISVTLAVAAASASFAVQGAEPAQLPRIAVQADEEAAPIKIDEVSSPKFTQPLLDTPQTISIVSKEVLQQQGATSLSQALRNTPGVTFLLGENGNTATGDSIFMRGFDTQGSIFIDNIRDLGTVTRDTFNTEQVEIAKGPSGPDNGRGAASGYVNMSTKVPVAGDFANTALSYSSGEATRITGDLNHSFGESGAAVRLNVMGQAGGIDGRDFIEKDSWAVAPSLAFGLGGATRAYFYLLHTKQDNIPDGGVPTIGLEGFYNSTIAGTRPAAADRDNFYGSSTDSEDVKATMFTARIEHDFGPNVTLRNSSRYGKTEQFYVLTGVNTLAFPNVADPATWTVSRSRQTKSQENELLTNQTNLTATVKTGAIEHSLTGGLEFINEKQYAPTYGGAGTMAAANLYHPNRNDPVSGFGLAPTGAFSDGETTTIGLYVFDTLKIAERWQLTGGIRLDDYDTDFSSVALATVNNPANNNNPNNLPVGTPMPTSVSASDTLFSYKVGVLFKPAESGSVYLSYATSQQPPGGTNFTLSAPTNLVGQPVANINSPNLDPQKATNIELGTKWDLLDATLAFTAAIFRSENENDLAQVDPTDPNAIQQFGKKRVDGIEVGVVGQITPAWQITAGIAKMDTEITEGNATGNNSQGASINWSPELTFTSWTTYQLPFGLTIGGGVRYVDTVFRSTNNTVTATSNGLASAPDYWVIDAMVGYQINDSVSLQLNGYNLADDLYVASLNNGGSRYSPGAPRSGLLTLNVSF